MSDPTQAKNQREEETAASVSAVFMPQQIGRYRVERVLGQGGYGVVYLAYDDQLQRLVAIKVPHHHLVSPLENALAYLNEARIVANLEHPNVVPVYDFGNDEKYPVFIVSKYIDGTTLAKRIKEDRPTLTETVELVAVVAETLHYAHCKGLVHRDIKPGNILLETSGKPFVTDFGLALREQDVGNGSRYAGTPAYMSPEQACGEGHRVDGRSDIFSLGVVLYELLTGRRPFKADSNDALLDQIARMEARPPRQLDGAVPRELDRICLKALSKRASERYSTAKDMAEDLRHFLRNATDEEMTTVRVSSKNGAEAGTPIHTSIANLATHSHPVQIVPKGLRSFDAEDRDFFLELLPGPRDRDGLPDSIRFWKTRIEEKDPDNTFAVGVLYGPSGCGKSSLVKAGLLPHLSKEVIAAYLEATAAGTETRLQHMLRKRCPALSAELSVKEMLAALRRGQCTPPDTKVLIVLDQFEQWLHANREVSNTELVQALRQSDGEHLQCILMVRDDFWMATTRLMQQLEIRLVEGQNSAAVDLFDVDHARKVLAAIGRAFGKLPPNSRETTREQKQFLARAVAGLTREGKVICVRLAVFAEMMKGNPWSPAFLKAVGGAAGLGSTFLEETFSAATAPPDHRYHQKAARAVLAALLPEPGTDIKAHMKSSLQLLEASGYAGRPKKSGANDFEGLLRILDREVRLITPTDPEGMEEGSSRREESNTVSDSAGDSPPSSVRYYQLTHDYLVPSLRNWLTRKQKETRRGRAELLLADCAAVWNARPEHRQLPTLLQWINIRLLTRKKDWTPPQRRMMETAGRRHAGRALVLALLLALVSWGSYEWYGRLRAEALRDQLLGADIKNVPDIVKKMAPYRRWIDPLLREANQEPDSRAQLHASIALLPVDSSQMDYLYTRLLDAAPQEMSILCDALAGHQNDLREKLWLLVKHPGQEPQRLRAACALAKYDPENERWAAVAEPIVNDFVSVSPAYLERWMDCLKPAWKQLQAPLESVFRDTNRSEIQRTLATSILADYLADEPQALADLLLDADAKQFSVLYDKLREHKDFAWTYLQDELDKRLGDIGEETAKEKLAKRQANAAVALLRLDPSANVWRLLKHSEDPIVRSYLIHRLGPMGIEAGTIIKRLHEERDITIRRALIQSLGEIKPEIWPSDERESFLAELQDFYQTERDPGLHASVAWLLRQWKEDNWLQRVNQKWAEDKEREKRTREILANLDKEKDRALAQWYVNSQGQTMVVIPGPVEFLMGSGGKDETPLHHHRIRRPFAISATAVTVEQYERKVPPKEKSNYTYKNYPATYISWLSAAAYCNWLSEQEGIPPEQWCYETNAESLLHEKANAAAMMLLQHNPLAAAGASSYFLLERKPQVTGLRKNYLSLSGYRLPTEAEMEYASRAGAITTRFYGESEELLKKYGWYVPNSEGHIWPVGSLKPNDLGFFDTHGNVWCWCQEPPRDYPKEDPGKVFEDEEGELVINLKPRRALRGNCYTDHGSSIRCARYWVSSTTYGTNIIGFRVARTMKAE